MAKERHITEVPLVLPSDQKVALVYLLDIFRELQLRLTEAEASLFAASHAAPIKVKEGMIRYADGTNWNPGSGAGLYQRRSGAWVFIG